MWVNKTENWKRKLLGRENSGILNCMGCECKTGYGERTLWTPEKSDCWLCGSGLWSNPVTCYMLVRGDFQLQPAAQKWKALGEVICSNRHMILIV